MPKVHAEQYDFRKGRIGKNVRSRKDTKAYASSVRDAENAMVLQDGGLWRRWGTFIRAELTEDTRLESWSFAAGETTRFILLFSPTKLKIFDLTLTERASFTGCPWPAEGVRFLQIDYDRARLVITDQTFRTQFLDYNATTGTFTLSDFEFEVSSDGTRLRAPFFQFASKTNKAELTIFTSAGQSTGYGTYVATAGGFLAGDFDLTAGTGKLKMSEDLFTAAHVGSRMRLLDGELEILSVVDAKNATVKVWRDIAVRLDPDPFLLRESSRLVQVSWFSHNFKVGDKVYFTGLKYLGDDLADNLLDNACNVATDGTTVAAPAGGAAAYTVLRVIDEDTFEISGGGSVPTKSGLFGGPDVLGYPFSGILGIKEPAMSEARGWPQSCCFHETRLWLGGTPNLPDAIWGSQFSNATNFDTGFGDVTDAVALYGVGQQARVRHIVSAFDLVLLTDTAEIYIPGNTNTPITQETARGVTTTNYGAAFTVARRFDGGTVFVDAAGNHIREMSVEARDQEYTAPPLTAAVPEWVQDPDETTIYAGAPNEATPYMIFTNASDGSALVLHSSRGDDSFGFMRWTLKNGSFRSFAGVGSRLFAVAQRGAQFFLLEFDTQTEDPITVDFATAFTADPAATAFDAPYDAGRTVQMQAGARVYSDVTVAGDGSFTIPEPLTSFVLGDGMPFSVSLHPPTIITGQGPKSGKMQRLVSVLIDWNETETGLVDGQSALLPQDNPLFAAPTPVDGWREYFIGKWDREPFCTITADTPGQVRLRGVNQDGFF
jgi:hypothetical protein